MSLASRNGGIEDRGSAVFAVTTATLVLATLFVAARLYCRKFIVKNISWDDKIMMLAWCIAFCLSFTIDYAAKHGLGRHDEDISDDDWGILRRCEYVFSILYNPALMATKTSILIFYLRLAKNTQKVLRLASWMTLVIVNIAGTVLTFMNIFQCRPIPAGWSNTDAVSKCIPLLTEFICASPINIVTDLAILALPIPVLTGMRLPPRQKTILVITFGVGVFVTIVDVVRIYYLQQAVSRVPTGITDDINSKFGQNEFAWNASLSLMWSAVEVNVGMTCACVPTLKPLIIKILPSMLFDPNGSSGQKGDKETLDTSNTPNAAATNSLVIPSNSAVDSKPQIPSPTFGRMQNVPENMTMLEFLTAPGAVSQSSSGDTSSPDSDGRARGRAGTVGSMGTLGTLGTVTTAGTAGTWSTAMSNASPRENAVYFGFVNMAKPKSMLRCSVAESWKYCTTVTILFLLWGMSYGLLNTLNNAVAFVSDMTETQTLGLTSIYWGGGYLLGPLLVGEWILRRDEHRRRGNKRKKGGDNIGGFKVTFIVGLCFYGIGTIIFWPSAVTNSFGGFMLSNFVVGFGLSILETGANAFLILCGPHEYGDLRLMLAQCIQGIGSVVAGLLAQKVFFTGLSNDGNNDSTTLINVQWTYLAITLVCVILALFFYYMPLPEVSDNELQRAASKLPVDTEKRSLGGLQLRTLTLALAVMAQWTYTAAQEGNSIFFRSLIMSVVPHAPSANHAAGGPPEDEERNHPDGLTLSIPDYLLVSHATFAASRCVYSIIMYLGLSRPYLPKPRTLLTLSTCMAAMFAILTITVHPSNPNHLLAVVLLFYFFEGPVWPLVFSLGLKGQGRRTKRAAAFITMGGSGPAFFPFVMHAIQQRGGSVQLSFVVVAVLHACSATYPLVLGFLRDARLMVDPDRHRRQEDRQGDESPPSSGGEAGDLNEEVRRRVEGRRRQERGRGRDVLGRITGRRKGSETPGEVEHDEKREGGAGAVEEGGSGGGRGRNAGAGEGERNGREEENNSTAV